MPNRIPSHENLKIMKCYTMLFAIAADVTQCYTILFACEGYCFEEQSPYSRCL